MFRDDWKAMQLYLCGSSALDLMRYLRSVNDGEIPGKPTRPRSLGGAVCRNAHLNALNDDAQRMLAHVRGKVHALVPSAELKTETSQLVTHVWSHPVPANAFINLGNGISISSPQFLFLQLAPHLSYVDLIMVGLELCGFYSLWKYPRARPGVTVEDEFKEATYNLQPATSAQRIADFVGRMKGERGALKARAVLKYLLDFSASPMESAVYLLLCFPRSMGGWGLPKPIFNARVTVTTSTTHETRYPDLYWQLRGLDVEYQSDYAHSGEWSRYRDSIREVELEAEDISVLPLTRLQLMDPEEFIAFATSVRRKLKVRTRPLPDDWRYNYEKLREQLLGLAPLF